MNIPELRFPEFEGEWEMKKLRDIASVKTGPFGSTLHESDYVDEGTPIITVEHLSDLGLVHENMPLVSNADKQRLKSYTLKVDDIVFSRVGSVDRNSIVKVEEEGWLFSGRLLRIRITNSDYFPKYLSYHFQQEFTKHKIRSIAVGQTMPSLNTELLKSFDIIFPNALPEQTKIANFLTAVDKQIELLQQKHQALQAYKKGMMQKLFAQEIRFKDEKGKDFPDWEEKRLGEVISFYTTNSLSRNNLNYENGSIKNIHYGDIHTKFKANFDITKEKVPFINRDIDINKIPDESYCQEGDIVIADASEDYNDIGKTIEIINIDNQKLVAGLHTFLGRDTKGFTVKSFKGYLMSSHAVRLQMMKLATGISVLGISKKNLSKVTVSIPAIPEQTKIANFLSALDKQIELINQKIEAAQQFKRGLLQKMFV